ncbi:glycoside hydrolase family 43 protein [Aulographum hederae CBS 113979]|uniref:Arabinan endo-1,5-alpha-L-arabinosidase n=1 Tax=Aulographum hederae CBS 113979 TaxID=1176131 RepID=A0A6G1GP94_9PEZI|nr:glycoside hydrolase family 43 protein [Aulographum hederae CBS 113979]
MVSFTAVLSVLVATTVVNVAGYAFPRACSGICGNAHDSSVIRRSDGTYIRYATGAKIAMHIAPSIAGPWEFVGAAIPRGSRINLKGRDDLWAPDVSRVGANYYLYYSVSSFGVQQSAIGWATSSDGLRWTDRGSAGITSRQGDNFNAIDAQLFVDDSGAKYMNFGSFWADLHQVRIPDSAFSASAGATRNAQQTIFDPAGEHAVEAAFLYQHGDSYFMFFSKGSCCALDKNRPAPGKEYRIMVCKASSPQGPFRDRSGRSCADGGGTVVLPSHDWLYAPGGQSVYKDAELGPVLVYHYVDTRIGYSDGQKKFGWNTLDFSSGWPVAE